MNRILRLVLIAGFASVAYGQAFEVASIRVNKTDSSGKEGLRISIDATPGNLTMRNVTLLSCVRWAYNVHDFQISGGPEWRGNTRFDIVAKPAAAATENQLRTMLQHLLADRFKLTIARQSKETPVYILTVGKNGHKLRPAKAEGERELLPANGGLTLRSASMSDLEQLLTNLPALGRPVLDRTGLDGRYDFSLILTNQTDGSIGDAKRAAVTADASTYGDALERIGLKLEAQKIPLDAIVIEHAEQPSEN